MFFRKSLGIEVTASDLRIAVVRRGARSFRLVQSLSIAGFAELTDDEKVRQLKDIVSRQRLSSGHVHLSLPREQGMVRQLEFPVEVREKVRAVLALQIETLTPWPLSEIYWDFAEAAPAKSAKVLSVTVAIIPRNVLDSWMALFKSVGLTLSGASLSSMVCAHGVSVLWEGTRPSVILGCEAGYVEGSLVQDAKLVSLTLPGAASAELCHSVAEKVLAVSRVTDLDSVRVIVHGSAASSLEEAEFVPLPIESAPKDSSRRFGVIAAALSPFRRTAFRLNLVPPSLRFHRNQLQLIPTYALVALTIVMGLAMVLREPYQLTAYAARINDEIHQIAPTVAEVSAQETELNEISERYRALAGHLEGRDQNLEGLLELSRILTADTWLTGYSLQNTNITISGYADSASAVQKTVEDSLLFKEVQFANSVTREAIGKDRFTLKALTEVRK